MTQPDPISRDTSCTLKSLKWEKVSRYFTGGYNSETHALIVETDRISFDLWFDEHERDIMPPGEYDYIDDNNEIHAWLDDYFNLFWMIKQDGHIKCPRVQLQRFLEELAEEKYREYLYDQELEHN